MIQTGDIEDIVRIFDKELIIAEAKHVHDVGTKKLLNWFHTKSTLFDLLTWTTFRHYSVCLLVHSSAHSMGKCLQKL